MLEKIPISDYSDIVMNYLLEIKFVKLVEVLNLVERPNEAIIFAILWSYF